MASRYQISLAARLSPPRPHVPGLISRRGGRCLIASRMRSRNVRSSSRAKCTRAVLLSLSRFDETVGRCLVSRLTIGQSLRGGRPAPR